MMSMAVSCNVPQYLLPGDNSAHTYKQCVYLNGVHIKINQNDNQTIHSCSHVDNGSFHPYLVRMVFGDHDKYTNVPFSLSLLTYIVHTSICTHTMQILPRKLSTIVVYIYHNTCDHKQLGKLKSHRWPNHDATD